MSIQVRVGDVVSLRDGRTVEVTNVSDPGYPEGQYQWIDEREFKDNLREVVTATMPAETILIGNQFIKGRKAGTVVTDISEVFVVL